MTQGPRAHPPQCCRGAGPAPSPSSCHPLTLLPSFSSFSHPFTPPRGCWALLPTPVTPPTCPAHTRALPGGSEGSAPSETAWGPDSGKVSGVSPWPLASQDGSALAQEGPLDLPSARGRVFGHLSCSTNKRCGHTEWPPLDCLDLCRTARSESSVGRLRGGCLTCSLQGSSLPGGGNIFWGYNPTISPASPIGLPYLGGRVARKQRLTSSRGASATPTAPQLEEASEEGTRQDRDSPGSAALGSRHT